MVDVGEFKVYEIGTGRKALVLFEDIFGIESGRHKTIADTYADLGFTVFLPEFLDPAYKGPIEDIPKILEVVQAQKIDKIKAKYEKLSAHIKTRGF
jgi:dienelactone hydrolase